MFLLLPLAWLWFQLINHLRIEWTLNEQYNYGWAVPFLAVYLAWQVRRRDYCPWSIDPDSNPDLPNSDELDRETREKRQKAHGPWSRVRLFFVGLCFLYFPTRLIQEVNPDWRLVSWALALEVVGITLFLVGRAFSADAFEPSLVVCDQSSMVHGPGPRVHQASNLFFPISFILVAVPWPTLLEGPLIQALSRANASVTVESLGLLGVPAIQYGNIIEVSTGPIGIDDACSGIRSFQASLMIALFLGQLFRLTMGRRLFSILAGFALSFAFNVGRTVLLTYVASVKGSAAIRSWHDPAGVAILVGCFLGLWGVAVWLKSGMAKAVNEGGNLETREKGGLFRDPWSGVRGLCLLFWVLFVEVAVESWYRWHEQRLPAPVTWTVRFPASAPDFRYLAISERTRRVLRFDDALNAAWSGPSGPRWQAIFLRWKPGRTAVHLARNHTPEVCLSSAGRTVVSQSEIRWYEGPAFPRTADDPRPKPVYGNGVPEGSDAEGAEQAAASEGPLALRGNATGQTVLKMPFRVYQVTDPTGPLHVFYCLWDDRGTSQGAETMMLTYANRLAPVLAGRRQSGQRSLEVAIWGYPQLAEAEEIFRKSLPKLVALQ